MMDVSCTLHANPLGSLRCDQLVRVNKAVNKKEQLEKEVEEEQKTKQLRTERVCT
jgi:hypothetical protein